MDKKALIKLPVPEPPQTDIPPKTSIYVEPHFYGHKGYNKKLYNLIYTAESNDGILILNIYHDSKILIRVFLSHDEYFNQIFPENRITGAMLDNVKELDIDHYSYGNHILNPVSNADEIIETHFQKEHLYPNDIWVYAEYPPGITKIIKYQRTLKERKLKEKHRKIKESIDIKMLEIHPYVKDFEEWIYKNPVHHYIIYSGKEQTGVCTRCKKTVRLTNAKHNGEGKCPCCHTKVTTIRSSAYRDGPNKQRQHENAWYIQKVKNGIVMRLFHVVSHLDKNAHYDSYNKKNIEINDEWSMRIYIHENGRYFINHHGTLTDSFEYGDFLNTHEMRWCRNVYHNSTEAMIYPAGADILKEVYPEIKYIPIKQIIRGYEYNPFRLMERLIAFPFIEYTWKLKLTNITRELLSRHLPNKGQNYIDPAGKSITDILGISKADVKEVIALNPSLRDLKIYKDIKAYKLRISFSEMKEIISRIDYHRADDIMRCLKYQSVNKFLRYIDTQTQLRGDSGEQLWKDTATDYCDYISEAEEAGYNLEDTAVLNPYDLEVAHDDADIDSRIAKYIKDGEKYAEQLAVRAASVSWLYYESDEYTIRPISTFDELINESREMRHCVGSYASGYASGRCIILCVRKKTAPEIPCSTLELSGDLQHIWQLRGFRNCTVKPEIKDFCNKWLLRIPELQKAHQKAKAHNQNVKK